MTMELRKLAIPAFALLTLVACKKDEPAPPSQPPAPTTGTVRLSLEFMSGMAPFDFSAAHTDAAGNSIRLTTLKFYMSGAEAKDDDGVTVGSFGSTYMLADASAATNVFTLGTMNPGHIHELHFTLGLDEATNRADPTLAQFPLNIPGMHWSWNPSAGYKFLNLEGYVDVNTNGTFDSGTDISFQYHCAQNVSQAASAPVLRESHVEVHSNVTAGSTYTVEAHVDVAALLGSVDLLATPVAMGNGPGNQQLMNALVTAITGH